MRKFFGFLLIIFLLIQSTIVCGDITIPKTVKVGLNYGNPMFDNINIKSNKPIELVLSKSGEEETISLKSPIDFSFRKDSYYNILDGGTKKIQYIKAVKYSGELIGPFHIRIGNTYKDYNSADTALKSMGKSIKGLFIAYENGWQIWNGLLLDEKECKEQIDIIQNKIPDAKLQIIGPDEKRIQITDADGNPFFVYNCNEIFIKAPNAEKELSLISFNGANYRGELIIKTLEDGSIGVINSLPLDQYLYGVVPCEMEPTWHTEALKAQAVAARNYALQNICKHEKEGYNLCSTQHCQVYKGYDKENPKTNEAIDQTKGKLLYYNNELAQTYYHSSSGGHTENSESIWSETIPYLRGVDDSYGLGSPYDLWISELDKSHIESKLSEYSMNIGNLIDIRPIELSKFGRVTQLEIIGTKDTIILEKEKFRTMFGTSNIKSIWYEVNTESDINVFDMQQNANIMKRPNGLSVVSADSKRTLTQNDKSLYIKGPYDIKKLNFLPSSYTFKGKGWGHGIGMSQYGAKGMAESGFNYVKILEHYYKGTAVR